MNFAVGLRLSQSKWLMTGAPKELTPRKKAPNGTKSNEIVDPRSLLHFSSSLERRSIARSLRIFPFGQRFVYFESRFTIEYLYINNPEKPNDIPNNAKKAANGFLLERTDSQNAIFVGRERCP